MTTQSTILCILHNTLYFKLQSIYTLHKTLQKSGLFLLCKLFQNEFPFLDQTVNGDCPIGTYYCNATDTCIDFNQPCGSECYGDSIQCGDTCIFKDQDGSYDKYECNGQCISARDQCDGACTSGYFKCGLGCEQDKNSEVSIDCGNFCGYSKNNCSTGNYDFSILYLKLLRILSW